MEVELKELEKDDIVVRVVIYCSEDEMLCQRLQSPLRFISIGANREETLIDIQKKLELPKLKVDYGEGFVNVFRDEKISSLSIKKEKTQNGIIEWVEILGFEICIDTYQFGPQNILFIDRFCQFIIPRKPSETFTHSNRVLTLIGEHHVWPNPYNIYNLSDSIHHLNIPDYITDMISENTNKMKRPLILLEVIRRDNGEPIGDSYNMAHIRHNIGLYNKDNKGNEVLIDYVDIRSHNEETSVYLLTTKLSALKSFMMKDDRESYVQKICGIPKEEIYNIDFYNFLLEICEDLRIKKQEIISLIHRFDETFSKDITINDIITNEIYKNETELLYKIQYYQSTILDVYLIIQLFKKSLNYDHIILLIGDLHAQNIFRILQRYNVTNFVNNQSNDNYKMDWVTVTKRYY